MKEFSKKLKAYYLKEKLGFCIFLIVGPLLLTLIDVTDRANISYWHIIKILLIYAVIFAFVECAFIVIEYLTKDIISKVKKKKVIK